MRSERRAAWRDDAGSVLLLMPAAVLIVMVLGAIAVDAAVIYLGERQAADLATSVANDAAALVDEQGFYQQDRVCLPQDDLRAYAASRLAAASDDRFVIVMDAGDGDVLPSQLDVVDTCLGVGLEPSVEVRVAARVPLIFSRALPGPNEIVVDARTRVRLAAQ